MVTSLALPAIVFAKIGVGIGTGKIYVNEPLKAGLIYTLPAISIINTGDEPSEYGVGVQFRENQPELRPKKEWFTFTPEKFYLEPGQTQAVQVKLTLPVKGVEPGDYFLFLQGYPEKKADAGKTSIGVAAAAKLYFTVTPSNFFIGIYYRATSLLKIYSPWSYVGLGAVVFFLLMVIIRRFFSFNIGISFKKK